MGRVPEEDLEGTGADGGHRVSDERPIDVHEDPERPGRWLGTYLTQESETGGMYETREVPPPDKDPR